MSYKIAVASSDGLQIDETFGSAEKFIIYEVLDGKYQKSEERLSVQEVTGKETSQELIREACIPQGGCGTVGGCSGRAEGGCSGGNVSAKVELISDCRCVVCKKIGFNIQKQLERKAISAFDVSCTVEEALSKISHYFSRIDNHESLRVQK